MAWDSEPRDRHRDLYYRRAVSRTHLPCRDVGWTTFLSLFRKWAFVNVPSRRPCFIRKSVPLLLGARIDLNKIFQSDTF